MAQPRIFGVLCIAILILAAFYLDLVLNNFSWNHKYTKSTGKTCLHQLHHNELTMRSYQTNQPGYSQVSLSMDVKQRRFPKQKNVLSNTNSLMHRKQNSTLSLSNPDSIQQRKFPKQNNALPNADNWIQRKQDATLSLSNPDSVQQRRFPKCLIIGFSKCGTTALRGFLTLHPDLVSPMRELRYFTLHYDKGPEWYRSQMPLSTESQITIEKSAGYITTRESLKQIHSFNSSIKLIVMIRDPITRLQSEYARCVSHKTSKRPSFKAWCGGNGNSSTVLRLADYASHLNIVYDLFPRQQVLVLSEEILEERPLDILQEVGTFLGLKPAFSKSDLLYNEQKRFYCFNTSSPKYTKVLASTVLNEETGCFGRHKGRPHPPIDREFFHKLLKVIRPYNQRLFRLIAGRKKSSPGLVRSNLPCVLHTAGSIITSSRKQLAAATAARPLAPPSPPPPPQPQPPPAPPSSRRT
ncbi:hypothetical protein PoB_001417800 [Plakobranchus ocellatus]|uniref:Sulfotransferase domain-containing protein n=1 Tax=Plakobranchus ocellatus TaxID=259542 RepID=A0AAV3YZ64_9GAST|nr:hypothetical protein PoB_001417800 [Plakobranchus ocellatus]